MKESYDKPRQYIKKQRHHFAKKGLYSQSYGFSSSHVQMWELDHKEGWALKNLMVSKSVAGENSWEALGQQDPDAGKDWRQKEKGIAEDEIVRYHHWLNGYEFEQTPGDSERQESLAFCNPWGRNDLDMTFRLSNNT